MAAVIWKAWEAVRSFEVILTYRSMARNSPGQARHVVHAVVSHVDEKLSRAFVFDLRGENPFVSSDH